MSIVLVPNHDNFKVEILTLKLVLWYYGFSTIYSTTKPGGSMPTVKVDLAQFKREKEAEWGRDITWDEITEGAGIGRNTLARLLRGDAQRVDNETLSGLCKFFRVKPGPVPFVIYELNGD